MILTSLTTNSYVFFSVIFGACVSSKSIAENKFFDFVAQDMVNSFLVVRIDESFPLSNVVASIDFQLISFIPNWRL